MKLEVGKKYRIKKFEVRPKGWSSQGLMDKFMGQLVTIETSDASFVTIKEEPMWIFREDEFEPAIGDWDK